MSIIRESLDSDNNFAAFFTSHSVDSLKDISGSIHIRTLLVIYKTNYKICAEKF